MRLAGNLRRLLHGAPATAVGLAALTLVVVGAAVGGRSAKQMLGATRDDLIGRLTLHDLEMRLAPVERGLLDRLPPTPGVAYAEERALAFGRLSVRDLSDLPSLVRRLPRDAPPRLAALQIAPGGRYPRPDERAVLVDRSLAELHGVAVGDELTLTVEGQTQRLPVVGVTLSPEHLLAPAHPAYGLPLKGSAGVLAVSEAATRDLPGAARLFGKVNSLLVRLAPDAQSSEVEARLLAALSAAGVSVRESVPRRDEPGLRFCNFLLAQFDLYLATTVSGFSLVGLVLLALLVARGIERRRQEVGLRLALGHGTPRIAAALLPLPLAAVLVGATLGAALGAPVAHAVAGGWARSMGFPPLVSPGLELGAALLATAVCLLTAALAALLPTIWLASRPACDLLHASPLAAARPVGPLARVAVRAGEWLRLPPPLVLAVAGVMRRRRETLGAILAVGLSVALVLVFLAVHVSHREEAQAALGRSTPGVTVYLTEPLLERDLVERARPLGGTPVPLVAGAAHLVSAGGRRSQRVLGVPVAGWLSAQPLARGRQPADDEALEALVDVWLANALRLEPGTRLTLYPGPDAPEGVDLVVVGVLDGMSMGRLIVPIGAARRLYGLPDQATGFLLASSLSGERLDAALHAVPGVEVALTQARALAHVDAAFAGSLRVLALALGAAVFVALLILSVLAVQDARDREAEVALLDALGWSPASLWRVRLGEVLLRGAAALLLAGLAAGPLARTFLARVEAVNGYRVALHQPAWLVALVLGSTLLLLPLAALAAGLRGARSGE